MTSTASGLNQDNGIIRVDMKVNNCAGLALYYRIRYKSG